MSENNMCEGAATSATIEEFSRICRTCLGQQNLRSIFGTIIENLGIANLLSDLLSIKIEKNDFLPSKICSTCMEELLRIHKFKKQCYANDVVLKNLLYKAQISSSKTELDEVVDFRLCNATRANKNFGDLLTSKDAGVSNNNIDKHGEVTYKIEELDITDDIVCRQTRAGNDLCKDDVLNKETTDIKQHDESIDILNLPKTESTPHDAPVETFTFDRSPHVFNKCGKKFEQEERLLHHKKEHELEKQTVGEPNEKLSCQFCGKSSKHTSSCKVHKMGLRDGSRYLGKKFTKKTGSSQHSKNREIQDQNSEEVDAEGQMYICYHCKKGFGNKAYLKKHLQWHGKRRFLCSVCGAEFISSYNLRMHSRIHTGERPHVCSVCEKSFTHFTTLIRHRRIHTGQKPYSCEFCGRQFTQRTHLNKHLRLHTGERPYACYLCEKVFIDNSSLTIHVRLHTGDRCFVCPICSKGYYTKSTRRKHMKQVHKVEEEVESSPGQSQVVTLS